MEKIVQLTTENIEQEHICCAISDKKCKESYKAKKEWLKKEFENGYVFRRLDARAKVFIEYGPAEKAWVPVTAPGYFMVNCFWVSGQYKGKGYGKELLRLALEDAKQQGKNGLVTVTGVKKFHFMSDAKWLLRQGFEPVQQVDQGFSLLALKIKPGAESPRFNEPVVNGQIGNQEGLVAYYSDRCPYSGYHVNVSLVETARKRNLPLERIKLETMEQAQSAPTPATVFSLFYKGRFVTTDVSACLDSRFDKIMDKIA
jgi:GNAT superfamily N-acetyltransferase